MAIRVNNAASLLETADYSMAEISAIVGYEDPLYFSRLFRKIKGMSPTDYRKLLKANTNNGIEIINCPLMQNISFRKIG